MTDEEEAVAAASAEEEEEEEEASVFEEEPPQPCGEKQNERSLVAHRNGSTAPYSSWMARRHTRYVEMEKMENRKVK